MTEHEQYYLGFKDRTMLEFHRLHHELRAVLELLGCTPRIIFNKAVIDFRTIIQGDLTMLTLTDTQQVTLFINPTDKKNHPSELDGPPVWTSSDPTVATVEAAPDGLSALVKATDNLGPVQVNVVADVVMGEEVKPLVGVLDVTVVAGETVSLGITAGTPEEQP